MNKLKLSLDDLAVESFPVVEAESASGTVGGNELTGWSLICLTCQQATCDRAVWTCAGTCPADATCGGPTCITWCTVAESNCDTCGAITCGAQIGCDDTVYVTCMDC